MRVVLLPDLCRGTKPASGPGGPVSHLLRGVLLPGLPAAPGPGTPPAISASSPGASLPRFPMTSPLRIAILRAAITKLSPNRSSPPSAKSSMEIGTPGASRGALLETGQTMRAPPSAATTTAGRTLVLPGSSMETETSTTSPGGSPGTRPDRTVNRHRAHSIPVCHAATTAAPSAPCRSPASTAAGSSAPAAGCLPATSARGSPRGRRNRRRA